jgi:hypothetical protein
MSKQATLTCLTPGCANKVVGWQAYCSACTRQTREDKRLAQLDAQPKRKRRKRKLPEIAEVNELAREHGMSYGRYAPIYDAEHPSRTRQKADWMEPVERGYNNVAREYGMTKNSRR